MRADRFTKSILGLIAFFLAVIAVRPLIEPRSGHAQTAGAYEVYIEPGVHSVRAPDGTADLIGKVVVDLRNGNVWGFPTYTKAPYPIVTTDTKPPTSKPILLGKFNFSALDRH